MFGIVMKSLPLVNVVWDDGWFSVGQDITPHINSTIGWLVGETEDMLYVASTLADQRDRHMGAVAIDKDRVIRRVEIEVPLGEYNEVLTEDDPDIEVVLESATDNAN